MIKTYVVLKIYPQIYKFGANKLLKRDVVFYPISNNKTISEILCTIIPITFHKVLIIVAITFNLISFFCTDIF